MTSDAYDFQSEPLRAHLSKTAFLGVHHNCFGRKPDSTYLLAVDLANLEVDIIAKEREMVILVLHLCMFKSSGL